MTTEVIPYLCIKGAARAIEFYVKAFGARETYARITDGEGRVGHAEITIGGSTLFMADEHPEIGVISPATLGGSHMSFVINLPNVDDVVKQAVAAGGRLSRPVENKFYGHRSGEITDPFGYRWTLSTKVEDVSEGEVQRRWQEEQKKRGS
ncbi:MAG TPA: VOC family protein [Methylomirabilota bacterium]|nr:VOC family protein [Methylomirabilota bacterium]